MIELLNRTFFNYHGFRKSIIISLCGKKLKKRFIIYNISRAGYSIRRLTQLTGFVIFRLLKTRVISISNQICCEQKFERLLREMLNIQMQ